MKKLLSFCLVLLLFFAAAPPVLEAETTDTPSISAVTETLAVTADFYEIEMNAIQETTAFGFSMPVRARYYMDGGTAISSKTPYLLIDPGNCQAVKLDAIT